MKAGKICFGLVNYGPSSKWNKHKIFTNKNIFILHISKFEICISSLVVFLVVFEIQILPKTKKTTKLDMHGLLKKLD